MLLLKEPIKLKILYPMVHAFDGFWERVDGNYSLIEANYSPGELFHLLSQPSEIYLEKGGMTTLVFQTKNQNHQKVRLSLVHNLLNRLMMAGSRGFTYQDTVYVQTMLRKLGIKNVSEFMEQLYEVLEDARNIKQLSNLYETNKVFLKTMFHYVKEEERQETEVANIGKGPYWIHGEIFKRLQSADIYDIAAAFQKNVLCGFNRVGSREVAVSEQMRTAEALKLKILENDVFMEESPLIDHRVNRYEKGRGEEFYQGGDLINELAGAVLLNISEALYQVCLKLGQKNRENWYQFQGEFSQTLETTLNRFQAYHFQGILWGKQEKSGQYQKSVNEFRKQEIRQLDKILELSQGRSAEILQKELEREIRMVFSQKENFDTEENIQREEEKTLHFQEESSKIPEENLYHVTGRDEIQVLEEINQISQTLENSTQDFPRTKEQVRTLKEEIQRLNEENKKKLEETEDMVGEVQKFLPIRINKERTRKETLFFLEHPELADRYLGEGFCETESKDGALKRESPGKEQVMETKSSAKEWFTQTISHVQVEKATELERIRELIKKVRERREKQKAVLKEFLYFRQEAAQVLLKEIESENLGEQMRENGRKMFWILQEEIKNEKLQEDRKKIGDQAAVLQFPGVMKTENLQEYANIEFARESLNFYHKEPQTVTVEIGKGKTVESLQVQKKEKTTKEQQEEKIVKDQIQAQTMAVRQQIHTKTEQWEKKNAEDIAELIQRSMHRQMNSISEQVCRKLEKKLSNDRKRRGI